MVRLEPVAALPNDVHSNRPNGTENLPCLYMNTPFWKIGLCFTVNSGVPGTPLQIIVWSVRE